MRKEYGTFWLSDRLPRPIRTGREKQAAVVIPLVKGKEGYDVLLEVRAGHLHTQPGEICFPGGGLKPGETPLEGAVRELCEELSVEKSQVQIFMASDYLETSADLTVYPFLGEVTDYRDTYSENEVQQVKRVPLSWFLTHEPDCYEARTVTVPGKDFPFHLIPGGEDYPWREGSYEVLFYRYGELVIWGMTARMMKACADILKQEGLLERLSAACSGSYIGESKKS